MMIKKSFFQHLSESWTKRAAQTLVLGSLLGNVSVIADTVSSPVRTFSGHTDWVTSIAISPDGQFVLSGSYDKTLKLWNLETGEEIRTFDQQHTDYVMAVAFSPDGRSVMSGGLDGKLLVWDRNEATIINGFDTGFEFYSVAFSPDGRTAVSGGGSTASADTQSDETRLWSLAPNGQAIRHFPGHTDYVSSVAFSFNGNYVLAGSSDKTLLIWDINIPEPQRKFEGHTLGVESVAFSPDAKKVLSGSRDKTIKLWNAQTGELIRTFQGGHTKMVTSVAFSDDGRYALSGSWDGSVILWDPETGREVRRFLGHGKNFVLAVAFSPDGRYALSSSTDRTIQLWQLPNQAPIADFNLTVSPPSRKAPVTVVLDAGPSTDSDGQIVDYQWSSSDGQTAKNERASMRFDKVGSYTITLKVTDNNGDTGTKTTDTPINIKEPNQLPKADFTVTPTQGKAPLTVELDGSASNDPDGEITQYQWMSVEDNQTVNGVNTTMTFEQPGTYTLSLTVIDEEGADNTKTVENVVEVKAHNKLPVANFTVTHREPGSLTVTLNGGGSTDSDGEIKQYKWSASDGQTAKDVLTTMTFQQRGTYMISLEVTDNDGTKSSPKMEEVNIGFHIPDGGEDTNIVTPSLGKIPLTVSLDAIDFAGSEKIDEYHWSSSDNQNATGVTAKMTFEKAGIYTITLDAKDGAGKTVKTMKKAVIAGLNLMITPSQGIAPIELTLDATDSSLPDGTKYEWLVNGAILPGQEIETELTEAGEYQIVLTVIDPQGQEATTQQSVFVFQPGQAIIIAGPKYNNSLFKYSNDFVQRMYLLLNTRGYSDEQIHYMNVQAPDLDLNGQLESERQDYRLFNPKQELSDAFAQAIAQLSVGDQFVFYLHGHANENHFELQDEKISATQLRDLLTTIPSGIQQVIILDTCFSGSFLDELAGVKHRVVVTSTNDKSKTWQVANSSFAEEFLQSLNSGSNLEEAFSQAAELVLNYSDLFGGQRPWLDDDGDGQFINDGSRAKEVHVGNKGVSQASIPEIKHVHPPIILREDEGTATLWVKLSNNKEDIHKVRAILVNPNYQVSDYLGGTSDFSRLELSMKYNPVEERYGVKYDRFCTDAGIWKIRYQAQDNSGIWSKVVTGEVQAQKCSSSPTVKMNLNGSSYKIDNDLLNLDMVVNGEGEADLYVAIVFPEGFYVTFAPPFTFSLPGAILVYQPGVKIAGQKSFSIIQDFSIPVGLTTGTYKACGVLVEPGTSSKEVGNRNNWIHINCAGFEVY